MDGADVAGAAATYALGDFCAEAITQNHMHIPAGKVGTTLHFRLRAGIPFPVAGEGGKQFYSAVTGRNRPVTNVRKLRSRQRLPG